MSSCLLSPEFTFSFDISSSLSLFRIEHVLRAMHNTAPTLSHEEEEWSKELKTIQAKLVNLKRKSEMVCTRCCCYLYARGGTYLQNDSMCSLKTSLQKNTLRRQHQLSLKVTLKKF